MITVQELIELLQEIENKDLVVLVSHDGDASPKRLSADYSTAGCNLRAKEFAHLPDKKENVCILWTTNW